MEMWRQCYLQTKQSICVLCTARLLLTLCTGCHGNTHVISTQTLKYNYNITLFLAVRLAPLVTRAFAASSLLFHAALCSGVSLSYIMYDNITVL